MPLIDRPIKRIVVDITGLIAPLSEAGHQFILALVYYTRYPKVIPLRKITTEAIAEAPLDIYSRMCTPEEVLTDQGTHVRIHAGVSRLLSIRNQYAIPSHLQWFGRDMEWNPEIHAWKAMPRPAEAVTHTLINPVLFA